MEFIYTVDPSAEEPIMLINKPIGIDEEGNIGIMGDQFQSELLSLDATGKRRVQVWITSEGGSVLEGEKIYSAILNTKCKVDTYCMGLAASIAAVIFQAGRVRYMADYGKLMYHNPSNGTSDQIKVFRDTIATMIYGRTRSSKEDVLKMMDRTTWILANEAVANGFCDEVIASSEANKGRLSKVSNDIEFWKESVLVLNTILKPKNKTMNKVTNKLGLVDGSNEESILSAIDKIENSFKEKEAELAKVKNSLQDSEKKAKDMEDALAKSKKEAEEKEAKEVENKADVFVTKLVADGKLKNDAKAIADVKNSYMANPDGIKSIYENMPVNKVAPKFGDVDGTVKADSVINNTMADLRAKHKI